MSEKIETVNVRQGGPNKANLRVLYCSLALCGAAVAVFLMIFVV